MTAALLVGGGLRVVDDYPVPEPSAEDALLRVRVAGFCGTDIEMMRGYAGEGDLRICGHEFVASVVGDEARRVVAAINYVPGEPGLDARHHPHRRVIGIREHDGAFAQYLCVPRANLVTVPDGVPDELAVFAEPLAAALRIGEQLPISTGAEIAVVGPGRLGMLIAWALAEAGAAVTLLGRSDTSLELGRRWGIATGLTQDQPADRWPMVVEASGTPGGVEAALRLLRPCGQLVLKSTWSARAADPPDLSLLVVKEIRVQGSRCGPMDAALRQLESGSPFADMIDGRFPLSRAAQGAEFAQQRGVRKVLLDVAQD